MSARLAYADPPYPGWADRYRSHPDYAGEVNHPGASPAARRLRRLGAVHVL